MMSMVLCSLRTVLPLKTVTASSPVLVTETCRVWSVEPAISTDRGQAAMAAPARAATGRTLESIFAAQVND